MALPFSLVRVLLLVAIAVTLMDDADAEKLECYECFDNNNVGKGKCSEPQEEWRKPTCPDGIPCMKSTINKDVIRQCGGLPHEDGCPSNGAGKNCYCNKSLCNESSSHSPAWWMVQLGAVLGTVMATLTSF